MKPIVLLFALLAVSCRATTTDREDVAGSKDSALATFLQPLEVRLRDDRIVPDRHSRELNYLGTGYGYSPYSAHYNPYNPVYGGQHTGQYNPYSSPYVGGLNGGYGAGAGGFGGGLGTAGIGGFGGGGLGGAFGGYPTGGQGGQLGYGIGQSAYPYGSGWNAIQSPGGYGSQLGGYYTRGLYI